MGKTVEGYVLDIDTAAGIAGATVTIYDANTNSALAGVVGLSTNPVNTDANGHFKFTMDLSPGPVYVDALNGGKHDRRMGLEQMQIGDHWMSDIPTLLHLFTNGVIRGVLNEFAVTVSGSINQYTVATGEAIVQGYAWSLSSGSYSATIAANTTLANRRSIVVLRQYLDASYQGRQVIDIVYGTVDATDPTLKQGVDDGSGNTIWEFPLATLNTVQNAGVSTITQDDRAFADNASAGTPRLNVSLVDEFSGALKEFTTLVSSGGVVAEGPLSLDANHPGVWTATTGGTNNAKAGVVGAQFFWAEVDEFEMIFEPASSGTFIQRFGLYAATTDQFGAVQNGVLAELDNSGKSDSQLTLRKYVAASPTSLGTLPLASHWYRLNWKKSSNTSGVVTLTDLTSLAVATATADSLVVGFIRPAMGIQAKAAANYVAALDYFRLKLGGMVR